MDAYEISLMLYNIVLIPVVFFSVLFLILTLINIFSPDKKEKAAKRQAGLPFISVQVPTFNDPIALRCIERCMEFDYPKDRYEIIIADDSTNPETQAVLHTLSEQNPGFVKYIHRDNRKGFKPGALLNAMKITKGEILVVFDSDWIPNPDFLDNIISPFNDPNVAIVQTRQGFYNHKTNLITRFAAYILMIYHTIIMPINNKINCVFFCGTAGALRRSAFEKVGGWNADSLTEDSELSVKLLIKGYKTVYMDYETPSEVPDTFESFIRQQMRWCYGNARVFFDNAKQIFFAKKLSFSQRFMICFITLSNSTAFLVIAMTFFGLAGWFLGDPKLFTLQDLWQTIFKFLITGGFLFAGIVTLYKRKQMSEFGHMVLSFLTMGLVLTVSNSVAFVKSIFNIKLHWFCTEKTANIEAFKK